MYINMSSLLPLEQCCNFDIDHDHFGVCVVEGVLIVSHVPRGLTCTVWHFLEHSGSCFLKRSKDAGTTLLSPVHNHTELTAITHRILALSDMIAKIENEGVSDQLRAEIIY